MVDQVYLHPTILAPRNILILRQYVIMNDEDLSQIHHERIPVIVSILKIRLNVLSLLVKRIACSYCEVNVLDMKDPAVSDRAKRLGFHSIPAVVIDDKLADCFAGRGPDEATLKTAGLGQPFA